MIKRTQSLGEGIANIVGHGVALFSAIVAVPFLFAAGHHPGIAKVVEAGVFAVTMVSLPAYPATILRCQAMQREVAWH